MLQFRLPRADASASESSADFGEISRQLQRSKVKIDEVGADAYRKLVWAADEYRGLGRRLVKEYGFPFATNATVKMCEIAGRFSLHSDAARTFCNAELPGGFIVALDKVCAAHKAPFDWLASSYEGPGALTDSYSMLATHPDKWLMRQDQHNGDVTDMKVVEQIEAGIARRWPEKATLYTSDAGTDVSSDFQSGEKLTYAINYGQVLCGLLTLGQGGTLLTKQYTFFLPETRGLLALLTTLFDSVDVIKPVTSRPANSEVYILAQGFQGCSAGLRRRLLARDPLPPSRNVDDALLIAAQDIFIDHQAAYLDAVISETNPAPNAERAQAEWLRQFARGPKPLARKRFKIKGGAESPTIALALAFIITLIIVIVACVAVLKGTKWGSAHIKNNLNTSSASIQHEPATGWRGLLRSL